MKRFLVISMLLCVSATMLAQTRQLFDNGWMFTREGKTVDVDLPHDWDIYAASDPSTGTTGEGGGWYPG